MQVVIYSIPNCTYCIQAKKLAESHPKVDETIYKMMGDGFKPTEVRELFPTARTFPQIIVDGEKIGGFMELKALLDG